MNDYAAGTRSAAAGVLVLHAWWGLNDFMRAFCDRLARAGFHVLAPDLYDGQIAATIPEAESLRKKLDRARTEERIKFAAKSLQAEVRNRPLGVIGFSLGAHWALWLNEQPGIPLKATILFYGNRGGEYAATSSAFQGHFAESDPYTAASGIKRLQKTLAAAGKESQFHVYPGTGHWFFESDRPEHQPEAAALAWSRTLKFLKANLR